MKVFLSLTEALNAAKALQEKYAYGVMVAESDELPGIFAIIPHRDESVFPQGVTFHYPTPKDQPILPPYRRRANRRKIEKCPGCGADFSGLCPTCYELRKKEILARRGIDKP